MAFLALGFYAPPPVCDLSRTTSGPWPHRAVNGRPGVAAAEAFIDRRLADGPAGGAPAAIRRRIPLLGAVQRVARHRQHIPCIRCARRRRNQDGRAQLSIACDPPMRQRAHLLLCNSPTPLVSERYRAAILAPQLWSDAPYRWSILLQIAHFYQTILPWPRQAPNAHLTSFGSTCPPSTAPNWRPRPTTPPRLDKSRRNRTPHAIRRAPLLRPLWRVSSCRKRCIIPFRPPTE